MSNKDWAEVAAKAAWTEQGERWISKQYLADAIRTALAGVGYEVRQAAKFERRLEIAPAYDKRPKYGIHGVEMRWYVLKDGRAIQFMLFTNWHLKNVQAELDAKSSERFPHLSCHPMAADIGYHSPTPMYEDQKSMSDKCHLLNGTCYYDGSSLRAEEFYDILVEEGGEALWTALEREWEERFAAALAPQERT